MRKADPVCNLLVFGCAHAAVDATCAAVLFSIPTLDSINSHDVFYLMLLYSLLAFGFQPLCGRAVDYFQSPKLAAIAGCVLLVGSIVGFPHSPVGSVLLAGLGNALFHVGGGTVSLSLSPNRAWAPGIFVAPGAMGLTAGIFIGKSGYFSPVAFALTLAILSVGIWLTKIPEVDYSRREESEISISFALILLALSAAVLVRSLVGLAVNYPWKTDVVFLILLTLAVSGGKALGGVLADRYGWLPLSGASLILSAPLVTLGINVPWFGLIGMLLFNMTMAVTLTAIAGLFPGRPGFSFGVPCLALFMGALMSFTKVKSAFIYPSFILVVILMSSLILFGGLILYTKFRAPDIGH